MSAAEFLQFLHDLRDSQPDHHRDPIAHTLACLEADAGLAHE